MNREEILERSRRENKNQDMYEKAVLKDGAAYSVIVAAILATVFLAVQIFAGEGVNCGMYALVFSISATTFTLKYIKLKRRHELCMAILHIAVTLVLTGLHIYNLITTSVIL